MENLIKFVTEHVERGECKCGKCLDVGDKADPQGHTADLVFFQVAKRGEPTAEEFTRLSKEHRGEFNSVDPFDGKEHNYMELGGWIGDQGLAMQYMGLGTILGCFKLLTPKTVLKMEGSAAMELAGMGFVAIQSRQQVAALG